MIEAFDAVTFVAVGVFKLSAGLWAGFVLRGLIQGEPLTDAVHEANLFFVTLADSARRWWMGE